MNIHPPINALATALKGMVNQLVSGPSEEIENDDNLAMNSAGESLIMQPKKPIFNFESNYKELVHEYVSAGPKLKR